MKHLNKYLTVGLITTTFAGSAFTVQASEADINDAVNAANATVTMQYAVELALQKVPGMAVGAKFKGDDGKTVWKIEIVDSNQTSHDLKIDATSGDVLKNRIDQADYEDKDD